MSQHGPRGWRCTRSAWHDGPCALVPTGLNRLRIAWLTGWRFA